MLGQPVPSSSNAFQISEDGGITHPASESRAPAATVAPAATAAPAATSGNGTCFLDQAELQSTGRSLDPRVVLENMVSVGPSTSRECSGITSSSSSSASSSNSKPGKYIFV